MGQLSMITPPPGVGQFSVIVNRPGFSSFAWRASNCTIYTPACESGVGGKKGNPTYAKTYAAMASVDKFWQVWLRHNLRQNW